jgi:hypothetical protein
VHWYGPPDQGVGVDIPFPGFGCFRSGVRVAGRGFHPIITKQRCRRLSHQIVLLGGVLSISLFVFRVYVIWTDPVQFIKQRQTYTQRRDWTVGIFFSCLWGVIPLSEPLSNSAIHHSLLVVRGVTSCSKRTNTLYIFPRCLERCGMPRYVLQK